MIYKSDKRVRIVSAEEIHANLQAFDNRLSEDIKNTYPISSMESLEQEFPNQWLAVLPTQYGTGRRGLAAGRLITHGSNKEAFRRELKSLQDQYPDLQNVMILFTGPHTSGGDLIVA